MLMWLNSAAEADNLFLEVFAHVHVNSELNYHLLHLLFVNPNLMSSCFAPVYWTYSKRIMGNLTFGPGYGNERSCSGSFRR